LDWAADIFRELYDLGKKDPGFMHNAPHAAQIARPDEVRAARQPVLRWQKG
jgi:glycine dehydrogenase subunit 2